MKKLIEDLQNYKDISAIEKQQAKSAVERMAFT